MGKRQVAATVAVCALALLCWLWWRAAGEASLATSGGGDAVEALSNEPLPALPTAGDDVASGPAEAEWPTGEAGSGADGGAGDATEESGEEAVHHGVLRVRVVYADRSLGVLPDVARIALSRIGEDGVETLPVPHFAVLDNAEAWDITVQEAWLKDGRLMRAWAITKDSGYGSSEPFAITAAGRTVTVAVRQGRRVEAQVVRPDGTPIEGVGAIITPRRRAVQPLITSLVAEDLAEAETDEAGECVLRFPAGGDWRLFLYVVGAWYRFQPLPAQWPEQGPWRIVVDDYQRAVELIVRDAEGELVTNEEFAVILAKTPRLTVYSGDDGVVRETRSFPPGRYELIALSGIGATTFELAGRAAAKRSLTLKAPGTVVPLEVILSRDGEPEGHTLVRLTDAANPQSSWENSTDPEGRALFEAVSEPAHWVVEAQGTTQILPAPPSGVPLRVALDAGTQLTAEFLDLEGKRMERCRWRLFLEYAATGGTRLAMVAEGRSLGENAVIEGLPSGTAWLFVEAGMEGERRFGPFGLSGPPQKLTVRAHPWAALRGRVVDAKGRPLYGVRVSVHHPVAGVTAGQRDAKMFDTTRPDGGFVIHRAWTGTVVIRASIDDDVLAETTLQLEPGRTAEHVITLR